MPYGQLFYHIIWSTKNRLPLLTPDIEPIIYGYLRSKAIALEARVFTLNGTPDHVHLVVSIPPKIPLAKFIGQVKAVASTRFNKSGIRSQPLAEYILNDASWRREFEWLDDVTLPRVLHPGDLHPGDESPGYGVTTP
jgi:REP element-mobilizing transposase RayT